MKIQFLFINGCFSRKRTLPLLQQIIREEAPSAQLEIIQINSQEDAELYHFVGSPTIRLDGEDIDPTSSTGKVGIFCRTYKHLSGAGILGDIPEEYLMEKICRAVK